MKKNISAILEECSNQEGKESKIAFLQSHSDPVLKHTLDYAYNPKIKWLLPEGDVPYEPNRNEDARNMYYAEARRLYLFADGGNMNLTQPRREKLFIDILEAICPEDAKMLCHMKDGKGVPYPGITKSLVKKAFPDILQ